MNKEFTYEAPELKEVDFFKIFGATDQVRSSAIGGGDKDDGHTPFSL